MLKKRSPFLVRNKFLLLGGLIGIWFVIMLISLVLSVVAAEDPETLTFTSLDGLTVTASPYIAHKTTTRPFILLFHQAEWSRGEYRETAPRLNKLGYNCLAVDLRAGEEVLGVENLTAGRAREMGAKTRFVDAMQDMVAAIEFVEKSYRPPNLILMGSSYSASLALKVGARYPQQVDGVIAFSPGEYFEKDGLSATWIRASAKQLTIPVFITSARKEKHRWESIYDAIQSRSKMSYTPATRGQHGSRALWSHFPDNEGYWTVLDTFLKSYF